MDNDFKLGTWNVLSLYRPGAIQMLQEQLETYKIDVTAIQEVRWLGSGIIDRGNNTYTIVAMRRNIYQEQDS